MTFTPAMLPGCLGVALQNADPFLGVWGICQPASGSEKPRSRGGRVRGIGEQGEGTPSVTESQALRREQFRRPGEPCIRGLGQLTTARAQPWADLPAGRHPHPSLHQQPRNTRHESGVSTIMSRLCWGGPLRCCVQEQERFWGPQQGSSRFSQEAGPLPAPFPPSLRSLSLPKVQGQLFLQWGKYL